MLHAQDSAILKDLSLEEREVFELRFKLQTAAIREEEALQAAEAEMIETVGIAANDADRAQRDCDLVRSKSRQKRSALQLVQQKNAKIEKEIVDLQERIAAHRKEMDAAEAASVANIAELNASSQAKKMASSSSSARPSDKLMFEGQSLIDLHHIVSSVRAEMDMEETSVAQVRRRHARSQTQLKAALADVQKLKEALQRLEQRQAHLQEQQLMLAAAQANPAHREAVSMQQEYQGLLKHLRAQEDEIRSERLEQQALVLHLLDGLGERTQKLSELRRRMLRAVMTQETEATGGQATSSSSSTPRATPEFANELLRENEQRRADVVSTIANVAKERDALHQYISVLSQRLETAIQKCNQLSVAST